MCETVKNLYTDYTYTEKSRQGYIRWALCEHFTSPCQDLACGRLRNDIIRLDIITRKQFVQSDF